MSTVANSPSETPPLEEPTNEFFTPQVVLNPLAKSLFPKNLPAFINPLPDGLNPLAPCFRPLSMVSSNEKFIGGTLNPNAPIFSIGDLANTQRVYDSNSLSHIASVTCVTNVTDNAFIVQNQVQIRNGLNPLAPCFRPLSMVSSNEKFIGSTLNPNAHIFL